MPRISLICVWNNRDVLDDTLLSSIQSSSELELILIDNRNRTYASAASALNAGASQAKGDYFAFVHQDVAFASPGALAQAVDLIAALPDCGVAGAVGVIRRIRGRGNGSQIFGKIRQGSPPGEWTGFNPITDPKAVITLDEILLIVPRDVFRRNQFDPTACPGWHLYGVEMCLSISKKGLRPYAIPTDLLHLSAGTLNEDYFDSLTTVCKKHRRAVVIPTTCGNWLTFLPSRWQRKTKKFLASLRK